VSHMLGIGAENLMTEQVNAATATRYGRREANTSDGRMTQPGSLLLRTATELNKRQAPQEGITLTLAAAAPAGENWPIPMVDYKPGDLIAYDQRRLENGNLEPLQVQTITRVWADDADAGSVTIQLMSRFRSSISRQQFALARLLNYSVTPTKPPDPVVEIPKDTTTPKAPTAVTVVDTYVYPEG